MSYPYAAKLPLDRDHSKMIGYPTPATALAVSASDNNAVSSLITFTDNTTVVEVSAVGAAAAIKWIATGNTNPSVITLAGTANFDNIIPANATRQFVVPIESQGTSSVVGLNKQAGLYNRMAVKSVGSSSVMTSQF